MKLQLEHLEVLANFMESHLEFARGRLSVSNARSKFQDLWAQLAKALNAVGLGEKPTEKWQKSWSDCKGHLKKKAAEIRMLQQATGGGPPVKELTDREKRILGILGTTFFMGVGVEERGINQREAIVTPAPHVRSNSLLSSKENEMQHLGEHSNTHPKSVLSHETETATSSRKRQLETENDHDYLFFSNKKESTEKKKSQQDCMNDIYMETMECLRSIQTSVDVGLDKIDKSIKEGFKELIEAKKKIYIDPII